MAQSQKETNNKPVKSIRVGKARAAIWLNKTESGPWYSVTFGRVYKQGDKWSESGSFNMSDLPALAKVASMACSWIHVKDSNQRESDD